MTATPADVARYTQDGFIQRTPNVDRLSIESIFPTAKDEENAPRGTFFKNLADCATVEAIRWAFLKRIDPRNEEFELGESAGIGDVVATSPYVPKATVSDRPGEVAFTGYVQQYVHRCLDDRYALTVVES